MFKKRIAALALALSLVTANALPVFAHNPNGERRHEKTATEQTEQKTVDIACIQKAVEMRDNSLIATWDTFSVNVKKAYEARRDALKAAWALTDVRARKDAIKAAWNKFQETVKRERHALKDSRKTAWNKFHDDRKVCGASEYEDRGEGADNV